MAKELRLLVLHPADWASGKYGVAGVKVKRVSIGGPKPRRLDTDDITLDGIGEVATREGMDELLDVARAYKPHVFLMGIHHGLTETTIWKLRRIAKGVKVVMHYTDQRDTVSKFIKPYLGMIDMLLVTNQDRKDHQKYLDAGIPLVRTLYDGFSPQEYWPRPQVPEYECFFGGNNFLGLNRQYQAKHGKSLGWVEKFKGAWFREAFIESVNRHFNLVIRGQYGWDTSVYNVAPMRFHPRYLQAMREAKIIISTVNVHRYKLLTRRLFRSIASGRLYFTEYIRGMEDFFEDGKHIVWYSNVNEGIDKLRYYLDNEQEREEIAMRGRALVCSRDTFQHRLKEFVKLLRETII